MNLEDEMVDRQLRECDALWGRYVSGRAPGTIDMVGYSRARRSLIEAHDRERRGLARSGRAAGESAELRKLRREYRALKANARELAEVTKRLIELGARKR